MTGWAPDPDGWESARRRGLAERGLAHLRRFREAVDARSEASSAADRLIEACGGRPPPDDDGAGGGPPDDPDRELRLELAGLLLERIGELRPTLEAERDGLTMADRLDVPPDRLPPDFARSRTPLTVLDRMVDEAAWMANLVGE